MAVDLKTEIGFRVKSARKLQNMTQAELAEAINKSFETVSNLERGKTAPSFTTLCDMSAALNVELKYFFDFDTESTSPQRSRMLSELDAITRSATDTQLALITELAKVAASKA